MGNLLTAWRGAAASLAIMVACTGTARADPAVPPLAAALASPQVRDLAMPGMDMPAMPTPAPSKTATPMPPIHAGHPSQGGDRGGMAMPTGGLFGAYPMSRDASGTSWQPDAAGHRATHLMAGPWMLMGHADLAFVYDRESGPRGSEKSFVGGMLMGAARRDFAGADTIGLRVMMSPEPFMGKGGYPLLLASGETADGMVPLIDRQHPHDLIMELSGTYSHQFAAGASVFLYLGYPGEVALGPPAFMHRASAMDLPQAPITHHWLDSTHIVFGVATLGLVAGDWKLEASQFTGREPDQQRFDFDPARFDSSSARLSWNPDAHWALQVSGGRLNSPEQLEPALDETRWTASALYASPLWSGASIAATLAWGLKHVDSHGASNAALAEAAFKPAEAWTILARAEWLENRELVPAAGRARVSKISLGTVHDWWADQHWKLGLGALYAIDFVPSALKAAYGSEPQGGMIFVRLVAN
jgi:hypothetical protein